MVTCVENLSCFPNATALEFLRLYEYQVGIPVPVILGILVGMIILAIYVRTRSIAHLSVLGIYAISIFSAMWASEAFFEESIHTALYVIAITVASVIVMLVLKLVKE